MGQRLTDIGRYSDIEKEFYTSLQNLCSLYGFEITRSVAPYPLNIAEDFGETKKLFSKHTRELELLIVRNRQHRCCLATAKSYDIGMCLYYIPVRPLVTLLENRKKRNQANLLLSVFAYLVQVAGISYLTEDYIGGTYEMIKDWYEQDAEAFDAEELQEIMASFRVMEHLADKIYKSIRHPYHLKTFAQRVRAFLPKNEADKKLRAVCSRFLWLYSNYPDRTIQQNVYPKMLEPQEEERGYPEQYLSFFWEDNGSVYHQLIETVNASLQEIGWIDTPIALQYFDQPQEVEHHDLQFETFFFDSISQLCELLNE